MSFFIVSAQNVDHLRRLRRDRLSARECLDAGVDSTKIAVDRSMRSVRLENSEHSVNTGRRVLAAPVRGSLVEATARRPPLTGGRPPEAEKESWSDARRVVGR